MKKLSFLFLTFLYASTAVAEESYNPFFDQFDRQIAFHTGLGVNNPFLFPPPSQFVPFSLFHLQYSIPSDFFGFPSRRSANIAMTVGYGDKYGWEWDEYNRPIFWLSEDVSIFSYQDFYLGAGFGLGLQGKNSERINSTFVLSSKAFAGYKLSDNYNIEIFVIHFSNGNTSYNNQAYGFYGLGISYNF